MVMIEVKDEVLSAEPRFRIRDENGNILFDNVTIEMITEILQAGTPLNKLLFDSIKNEFLKQRSICGLIGKYNIPTIEIFAPISSGNYLPTFSSETSGDFSVVASSFTGSSSAPYKALDGDESTYWRPDVTTSSSETNYLRIALDSSIVLKQINLKYYADTNWNVSKYAIKVSNDNSNYETLSTGTLSKNVNGDIVSVLIDVNDLKKYQYVQIEFDGYIRLYSAEITKWISNTSYNIFALNNQIDSYEEQMRVLIQVPDEFVGGNIKLNINTLGEKIIEYSKGFEKKQKYELTYNGTNFEAREVV